MRNFEIIVQPTDPDTAKVALHSWLDQNSPIRESLGDEDLIRDEVLSDGGQVKHQYRIRRGLLPNGTCGEQDHPNS